jgi:hypothetical protein
MVQTWTLPRLKVRSQPALLAEPRLSLLSAAPLGSKLEQDLRSDEAPSRLCCIHVTVLKRDRERCARQAPTMPMADANG